MLRGANRLVNRLVGGWQLGTIFQWQSGAPIGIPVNVMYLKDASMKGSTNNPVLPGAVAGSYAAEKGQIFSPCAEVWNSNGSITPEPAAVAAGCTSYNFLVMPQYAPAIRSNYFNNIRAYSYPTLYASLSKITNVNERFEVQVRADVYNATNSVGRATPDSSVTSPTFGLVQLTNSRSDTFRTIQLSLKALF